MSLSIRSLPAALSRALQGCSSLPWGFAAARGAPNELYTFLCASRNQWGRRPELRADEPVGLCALGGGLCSRLCHQLTICTKHVLLSVSAIPSHPCNWKVPPPNPTMQQSILVGGVCGADPPSRRKAKGSSQLGGIPSSSALCFDTAAIRCEWELLLVLLAVLSFLGGFSVRSRSLVRMTLYPHACQFSFVIRSVVPTSHFRMKCETRFQTGGSHRELLL